MRLSVSFASLGTERRAALASLRQSCFSVALLKERPLWGKIGEHCLGGGQQAPGPVPMDGLSSINSSRMGLSTCFLQAWFGFVHAFKGRNLFNMCSKSGANIPAGKAQWVNSSILLSFHFEINSSSVMSVTAQTLYGIGNLETFITSLFVVGALITHQQWPMTETTVWTESLTKAQALASSTSIPRNPSQTAAFE